MQLDRMKLLIEGERAHPEDPFWAYSIAFEKECAGETAAAISKYQDVVARFPSYFAAHHRLGLLLANVNLDDSLVFLEQASALAKMEGNLHRSKEIDSEILMLREDY